MEYNSGFKGLITIIVIIKQRNNISVITTAYRITHHTSAGFVLQEIKC